MAIDVNQQILAKLNQIFQAVEATRKFGTTINNPVAAVASATVQPPGVNTPGIVTRNIPSGTQQVAVTNLPPNLSNDNVVVVNTPNVNVVNLPATQLVAGVVDVTDRTGRLIGHVTVDNFPASQPVSGTVSISNFPAPPADQLVHGSVSVSNFPAPVTSVAVNNFPATQPVSGAVDVTDRVGRLIGHTTVDNFPATQPISGTVSVSNFPASQAVTNPNLDVPLSTRLKPADSLAAVTSITNPVTVVQPTAANLNCSGPALVKGTQAATGFSVQELKDAGRQQVLISWELVASTTAEALTNFTNGSRGGVALTAASSYTVSAGKTLRIQSVIISFGANGSAAANYRVHIRQAAAVTATSPVIFSSAGGGQSNACVPMPAVIPDGLELAAGQQIAMTHLDTAAGGILSVSIIGFEY